MNSKLALLDRDGTLIENIPYLADPKGVRLLEGVTAGLLELKRRGFKLVLTSNQSGLGRGYFSLDQLQATNARLQQLLQQQGVELDLLLFCPHAPAAQCSCRKPAIGMAQQASHQLQVGLQGALVIGDSDCDLGMAQALGCPALRFGSPEFPHWSRLDGLLDQLESPLHPNGGKVASPLSGTDMP